VVADVAGKGASAGLTMARSMGLIRAATRIAEARGEIPDPADLLSLANGDLATNNPEMTFVTAALAILDAETGEGRICIAGHEAPLRLAATGVAVMSDYRIQPPLGIIEDLAYTSAPFTLAPGEAMLLLSDGVTEAHDPDSELFGKDRVLESLGARTDPALAIAVLLKDVAIFVRGAPPADDVTVLAVRYVG